MKQPEAIITGVGPGSETFVTERCRELVSDADVLAGFSSPLDLVEPYHDQEPVVLTYDNQQQVIANIYEEVHETDRIVVCCWGDPSVSDREFVDRWKEAGFAVQIVPGVSSIMVACARAQIPMEQSLFLTFHKRGSLEPERREMLDTVRRSKRNVIALPHPWDFMPTDMASWLLERTDQPDTRVQVFEKLSLPDEEIHSFSLRGLSETDQSFSDLSIVVIQPD